MATPMNAIDMARFRKLVDLIEESGDGEVRIYVSKYSEKIGESYRDTGKSYVHLELTGKSLDPELVKRIFALPVEELLTPSAKSPVESGG